MAPLFRKSQVTTHDEAKLETGFESNMTDEGTGPSRAVTGPPPSSLTSLPATPDLLSSNLRRKIRRTGFSSIPSFSSVNASYQRNSTGHKTTIITQTSEKQLLLPEGGGGQQEIMHDGKVLIPSAMNAGIAASKLIVPKNSFNKVPDQLDLRRITAESISSGKRLVYCSNTI